MMLTAHGRNRQRFGLDLVPRAASGVIASGIGLGKRVFASRSASAVGAATAAAAAAGLLKRRKVAKVDNAPGPQFNPGGAGGWKQKVTKNKRRKKRKVKIPAGLKKALETLIKKKVRTWENISKTQESDVFAVFTSNTFPIDPTPATGSVRASDVVGWYHSDFLKNADCISMIGAAYRRDAYAASGATVVRNAPFPYAGGDITQREFKMAQTTDYLLKNNGSQTAFIEVFEVVATAATDNSPLIELNKRYQNQYVLDTGIIAGTDPQVISKSFDQSWYTPKMSSEQYNVWKKKSAYKICLNPGDETKLKFVHRRLFSGQTYSTIYSPGSYSVIFRIQGSLTHSAADARAIHYSIAQVDVRQKVRVRVDTREAVFTGQQRIVNNDHDAFADDVTAGDALQHGVAA